MIIPKKDDKMCNSSNINKRSYLFNSINEKRKLIKHYKNDIILLFYRENIFIC